MPTECVANPLQRALADAIILMKPLDEIRILLACGAKVPIITMMFILMCILEWNKFYSNI